MTYEGPPTANEDDAIVLQLRDENNVVTAEVDRFESYSFNSHFLVPTDGFSFTLGDEQVNRSIFESVFVGQRVTLSINGLKQADGYIDVAKVTSSRDGGTKLHVEGRDRLSPLVDANADPRRFRFAPESTLEDVLVSVLSDYGWTTDHILIDNAANKNAITGSLEGVKTTKKGKPLKSFVAHQLKPYPQEGVFAFLARLSQRFGLWIWVSSDGDDIIVSRPDFEQEAGWPIIHKIADTSRNNVLRSEVSINGGNQPSVIIATGFGGGGEYDRSGLKVAMVNELTGLDALGITRSEVVEELARHPDALLLNQRAKLGQLLVNGGVISDMSRAKFRALYLHDDESKTVDQLSNFVRREMALKQRLGVSAHYTLEGHTINRAPWCVDTMVKVDDDVSNMHTTMYVLSRTFEKSRGGGTLTHVELIMPYTLEFGE